MQVLLIEDNPDDALIISRYAAKDGAITLTHRDTLDDGLAHIAEQPVDVLLLDLALPDGFGLAIYDAVMARFPTLPVIILSGSINDTIALDAVRHGAQDYLVKGSVNEHILAHALRYAVERKRIENELAAERNLLRTVLDSSPDYIYTKDLQGNYVTVNRAILDGRGLESVDQMAGLNAFDITPPELAQAIEEDERKILTTGEPLINREEMHTLPETGQTLWLLTTKVPLRDHNRQITGLLAISRDITERKLLEAQLMQERDQLRSLIDGIPDYIFIKDAKGRFVVSNNCRHSGSSN